MLFEEKFVCGAFVFLVRTFRFSELRLLRLAGYFDVRIGVIKVGNGEIFSCI